MATLEEVSTSAREEDLDRRSFQIDNLQITKLDSGRLYATKENKKENDRSLWRELPPSWVSKDVECSLVMVQEIYQFPPSDNPSGYSFQIIKSQLRRVCLIPLSV